MSGGAHQFSLPALAGGTLNLADYAGRPILLANTASRCGFTPHYAGLQRMWSGYRNRGLVVIGVPSNDFGRQEPGGEAEIGAFCYENYGVSFPMAAKLHVSGREAHPLFRFLGDQGGALARPRWNFYKYLIGPDGRLVAWFSSLTRPDSSRVKAAVERELDRIGASQHV
jgi:glutathione peroxidase